MRILASMAAAVLEQRRAQADARAAGGPAGGHHRAPADLDRGLRGNGALLRATGRRARARALGCTADGAAICSRASAHDRARRRAARRPTRCPRRRRCAASIRSAREIVVARADGERLATLLLAAAPIFARRRRRARVGGGGLPGGRPSCTSWRGPRIGFLRVAAHELRTPITALHATTQLIEMDPTAFDDAERRDAVMARIRRQTRRLVGSWSSCSTAARATRASCRCSAGRVDLVALCRDVVEHDHAGGGPRAVRASPTAPVIGRLGPGAPRAGGDQPLVERGPLQPADGEVLVEVRAKGSARCLRERPRDRHPRGAAATCCSRPSSAAPTRSAAWPAGSGSGCTSRARSCAATAAPSAWSRARGGHRVHRRAAGRGPAAGSAGQRNARTPGRHLKRKAYSEHAAQSRRWKWCTPVSRDGE